jgi:hypothetical protein
LVIVENSVVNHRRSNQHRDRRLSLPQDSVRLARPAPIISQQNPPHNTAAMCTTHVYTYVRPDGREDTVRQPTLCPNARRNKPCPDNVVFQMPSQYLGAASAPVGTSYMGSHLPPTPSYTPRSSTPNYRSGDESDRSHRSGSSSRSNKKRSSGLYITVNGQPIVDTHRRERHGGERIVLVDSPPTPLTPPQTYTGARTAPSSPSMPYIVEPPSRSSRPVIVDERPRVKIEVQEPRGHARHSSTSSRDSRHSRHSHSSSYEEEERQHRHERRRHERMREEEAVREQKLRDRIAKANRDIANRPAAPMPPAPPRRSSRPVVEMTDDAELAEALRRVRLEKESRRMAEEEEAQRLRLLERIQPKRRATVGPGSRRTRVLYDDGVYRWE